MWEEKGRHCSEKFIFNLVINHVKNPIHHLDIFQLEIMLNISVLILVIKVDYKKYTGLFHVQTAIYMHGLTGNVGGIF